MSTSETPPQPPYPLHESVRDKLHPEYVAFYNEYIINRQQVHLQPVAASRTSGILIPGGGPVLEVGKTEDLHIKRKETETETGQDVPVRVFTPTGDKPEGGWPVFLYFHGGGWVLGNIDTENTVCSNVCVRARCVVVTVDYRCVFHIFHTYVFRKPTQLGKRTDNLLDSPRSTPSPPPSTTAGKLSSGWSHQPPHPNSPSTPANSPSAAPPPAAT
jgi:hypothetical protein